MRSLAAALLALSTLLNPGCATQDARGFAALPMPETAIGFHCPAHVTQTISDGKASKTITWRGPLRGNADQCVGQDEQRGGWLRAAGIWTLNDAPKASWPDITAAMVKLTREPPGTSVEFNVLFSNTRNNAAADLTVLQARVVGLETITTPAGSFQTVVIDVKARFDNRVSSDQIRWVDNQGFRIWYDASSGLMLHMQQYGMGGVVRDVMTTRIASAQ